MKRSKETLKMGGFVAAGVLMVLLAIGAPTTKKKVPNERRIAVLVAQEIMKKCVPGTQVDLPPLVDNIPFLCYLEMKSGLLNNLGPVSIPRPIIDGEISIK